jgi:N-glycosylase/DNA lyase
MTDDPCLIESVVLTTARQLEQLHSFDRSFERMTLFRQLVQALVSSRVRWETATGIADDLIAFCGAGTLSAPGHSVNANRHLIRMIVARHRHPAKIEKWLCSLLCRPNPTLYEALQMLTSDLDEHALRNEMVRLVDGLGPKQSSLLLRNMGRGRTIAILDRHVLRFMALMGLTPRSENVADIRSYERVEQIFLDYARLRSFSADTFDLAIWIVMRAATSRRANAARHSGFRWT